MTSQLWISIPVEIFAVCCSLFRQFLFQFCSSCAQVLVSIDYGGFHGTEGRNSSLMEISSKLCDTFLVPNIPSTLCSDSTAINKVVAEEGKFEQVLRAKIDSGCIQVWNRVHINTMVDLCSKSSVSISWLGIGSIYFSHTLQKKENRRKRVEVCD